MERENMGLFEITVREDPDGDRILRFDTGFEFPVRAEYATHDIPGNFTVRDAHMKPESSDNTITIILFSFSLGMAAAGIMAAAIR